MSCVEIYAFDKKGNAYCYGKVKNSFRGEMAVWHMLEERHLPPFIPESVKGYSWYQQGNSIYFPEITICSTLGLKAAI